MAATYQLRRSLIKPVNIDRFMRFAQSSMGNTFAMKGWQAYTDLAVDAPS